MIDYTRAFHTGVLTPDLDEAIEFYSRTLGLKFAEPYEFEALQIWTPERGLHHLRDRFTFSVDGPVHLELQRGDPGSFYDPELSRGDHLGIWVSDLPTSVDRLTSAGWTIVAAGDDPQDGLGLFTYLRPKDGGMVIELVSEDLKPVFDRWFEGGPLVV